MRISYHTLRSAAIQSAGMNPQADTNVSTLLRHTSSCNCGLSFVNRFINSVEFWNDRGSVFAFPSTGTHSEDVSDVNDTQSLH
jgi:hypothetical protein